MVFSSELTRMVRLSTVSPRQGYNRRTCKVRVRITRCCWTDATACTARRERGDAVRTLKPRARPEQRIGSADDRAAPVGFLERATRPRQDVR